eukprot:jgi/Mesvir1/11742/Mv00116-RA.1
MALVYINTSVSASFCQNAGGFSSAQPAVARTARQERASWLGSPLVAKAKLAWQPRRAHKSRTVAGLNIDRRAHLEKAWRDQEEQQREAELADVTCPVDCVREVYNLAEFEAILLESEKKNELVVVDFYNPSCGACKFVLPQYISLCKEGAAQETAGGAGAPCVRFVKHNIENEYAERTVGGGVHVVCDVFCAGLGIGGYK